MVGENTFKWKKVEVKWRQRRKERGKAQVVINWPRSETDWLGKVKHEGRRALIGIEAVVWISDSSLGLLYPPIFYVQATEARDENVF